MTYYCTNLHRKYKPSKLVFILVLPLFNIQAQSNVWQCEQLPSHASACLVQDIHADLSYCYNEKNTSYQDDKIHIQADNAKSVNMDEIEFSGQVIIQQQQQVLLSENVKYFEKNKLFMAQNEVDLFKPGIALHGINLNYYALQQKGSLEKVSYTLPAFPAQGKAEKINFDHDNYQLIKPSFSSCSAESEDWRLDAGDIKLFSDQGYGSGRDVVVKLKEIPIFYTPYIEFPINEQRKSGLLFPHISYSSKNGLDLSLPYYLNIAPNMDATITPRVLTKNGLLLSGEFRYLGIQSSAELQAEMISDLDFDKQRDNYEIANYGEGLNNNTRGALSLQHQYFLSSNWQTQLDLNYVSDNYYFNDFGNNLYDSSKTHLSREANIRYNNTELNFLARVQSYQSLLTDNHVYSRLPQLVLNYQHPIISQYLPMNIGFSSEAVNFAKNNSYQAFINEGSRYFIRPFVELDYHNSYGFIKPRVSFDYLQYDLAKSVTDKTRYHRQVPIFSVDSGLVFERHLNLFNQKMRQTLEPRVFYLNTAYQDQSEFPIFDTALHHFNFGQLFRENRFSGVDRLADANQLTTALSSRLVDAKGMERLRVSIGQINYFKDRNVSLSAISDNENKLSSSVLAAEIVSESVANWNQTLSILYNPHTQKTEQGYFRFQYKPDPNHIANLVYIYNNSATIQENIEQLDISTYWQIKPRWHALARWNYSVQESFTRNTLLGIEYESCCYAVRLVAGQEKNYANENESYRIMLQMNFKGLSSVGNISRENVKQHIAGFESTF